MTKQEWYKHLALTLAEHHKRHCDGATCNISLGSIREMAEAAGATFTAEEREQFI
jgi:hypothetical protein